MAWSSQKKKKKSKSKKHRRSHHQKKESRHRSKRRHHSNRGRSGGVRLVSDDRRTRNEVAEMAEKMGVKNPVRSHSNEASVPRSKLNPSAGKFGPPRPKVHGAYQRNKHNSSTGTTPASSAMLTPFPQKFPNSFMMGDNSLSAPSLQSHPFPNSTLSKEKIAPLITPPATVTPTNSQPPSNGVASSTVPTSASPMPPQNDDKTVKENGKKGDDEKDQVEKIRKFVDFSLKHGLSGMEVEWLTVRSHVPASATRIQFDANSCKNRFQDMICIDQTRVQIEGERNSYIHASWTPINETKNVIVAQLPLPNCASAFWKMCLQQKVKGILVILTPFELYHFANNVFPAKGDFIHYANHLKVGCVKRVEMKPTWDLDVITIKHRDKQSYMHVHFYKDWQHQRRPGSMRDIWALSATFKQYANPHVYLSLSGGGRAGTFAAFELAHSRLHHDIYLRLNVADVVMCVRNSRMHAVQSLAQYQFIYMALLYHIFEMKGIAKFLPMATEKREHFKTLLAKLETPN